MTEKLLQYIWQFQYFNLQELSTIHAEPILILHAGMHNTNQGPDFLNAKIKVGDTIWAGNIEVHVMSSEWFAHKHHADRNYDNVILHVVWHHDSILQDFPFPTLELSSRIPRMLLNRYDELMQSTQFIPCENHIASVPDITILSWKERLIAERLQQKTIMVARFFEESNGHWEEVFWWMLARNFGTNINSRPSKSPRIRLLLDLRDYIHYNSCRIFAKL